MFAQTILEFQEYLLTWKQSTSTNNHKFMPDPTYMGFEFTLQTAIQVATFLTQDIGYEFLMTARLNQDALEVISYNSLL